ncbi:MAG: hypothetical protein M3Y08_19490 [Fibrobacterota bacterium]|nr:hypothetical protein [Fibrobacterota bacterium]
MKKNLWTKKFVGASLILISALSQNSYAEGTPFSPGVDYPFFRRDAAKSEGWKELSTPLLHYCQANEPFKSQQTGNFNVTSLAIAPNGDYLMFTIYGVMRSRDKGVTWVRIDGESKDSRGSTETGYAEIGNSISFDPGNSNRIAHLGLRGNSYFSNGTTWKNFVDAGLDFGSIDWTTPNPLLMAGPRHGTWIMKISRDGGNSWTEYDNKFTGTGELGSGSSTSMITVIDDNTMIYNSLSDQPSKPSGLFRSTDKGVTWTKLRDGLSDVSHIGVALADGRTFFMAEGKLWKSTDKGATWTSRSARQASQGPQLYGDWSNGKIGMMLVKRHEALSYSIDEGVTWTDVIGGTSSQQFPPKSEGSLDGNIYSQAKDNGTYNADNIDSRYGGGLWAYDASTNTAFASSPAGPVIFKKLGPGVIGINQFIKSGVAPGPVTISYDQSASRLNYSIAQSGHVRIDINGLTDRSIKTVVDQNLDAGSHSVSLSHLPRGMIVVSVKNGSATHSRTLLVGASK